MNKYRENHPRACAPYLCLMLLLLALSVLPASATDRPNILWIIAEDMGPWLGSYGNKEVSTPNLDALAARSVRFTHVWSGGGACSPSRSSLFTGKYSISLGTETHREPRPIPEWAFFAQYLRQAGYYCTNNAKTDYNAKPMGKEWWDASGKQANYANRAAGQPFFHCYSSLMETHMSCLLNTPPEKRTTRTVDPATVRLPAYLPDDPLVRDDRAWHLEWVGRMDKRVGDMLAELERSGQKDNTIVFFFSDHGGCMPDGKGFAWEFGFRVPLLVYFPEKYAHLMPAGTRPGGTSDQLVSFLDFGPTLFSLTGTKAPEYLQGQPFAGPAAATVKPREWLLAFRGINGGVWDPVRTIRDRQYLYTRNYLAHRPAGQRQDYQWLMPSQRAWEADFRAGQTNELQSRFFKPRPVEELYDLSVDPEQTRNLASEPAQAERLAAMRAQLRRVLDDVGDIAFVPNSLRAPENFPTFYDRMQADPAFIRELNAAADLASAPELVAAAPLEAITRSAHPAVRYWAAIGLTRLAYAGVERAAVLALAEKLAADPASEVRVAAAEARCAAGDTASGLPLLLKEIAARERGAREALAAIETLGPRAAAVGEELMALLEKRPKDFPLRSALVSVGRLPFTELYLAGADLPDS